MHPDFEKLEVLAREKEEENREFRTYLKWNRKLSDKRLDRLVSELTDNVWADIDCASCRRCCKELRPEFTEKEQQRLAKRLGMSVEQFREQYLKYDDTEDEPGWRTRHTPCPFLDGTRCSVHEDRPKQCRDYPYLYEPDFSFRTIGMIERTFTCPVVFQVMEELKKHLGFRYRRR